MARPERESSNSLFDELAEWNEQLKHTEYYTEEADNLPPTPRIKPPWRLVMTVQGSGGGEGSKRQAPFSLRLSFEERAKLEDLAGEMSLSAFIKEHLFKSNIPKKRRRRRPAKDKKLLAQLLAVIGKSRLPQNMNQLAKATHTGTLSLPRDVAIELHQACSDIRYMRNLLMKGLGLRVNDEKAPKPSLQTEFAQAAVDTRDIHNIRPMRPQP